MKVVQEDYLISCIFNMLEGLESDLFNFKCILYEINNNDTKESIIIEDPTSQYTFTVMKNFTIDNMLYETLNVQLRYYMRYGSIVKKFQLFIKEVDQSTEPYGYIYRSFSSSISNYLQDYYKKLFEISSLKMNMAQLYVNINEILKNLDFLNDVFEKVILPIPGLTVKYSKDLKHYTKSFRAFYLFSSLYNMLKENYVLYDSNYRILWNLFIDILRVYIQKLDDWIRCGYLSDDDEEFFIINNKEISNKSPYFWSKKFSIRNESEIPSFLKDYIHNILSSGKNIILIQTIHQKFHSVNVEDSIIESNHKLFSLFLKDLQEHFNNNYNHHYIPDSDNHAMVIENSDDNTISQIEENSILTFKTQFFNNNMNIYNHNNDWPEPKLDPWNIRNIYDMKIQSDSIISSGTPIDTILHQCLGLYINKQHDIVSKQLKDIFIERCNLIGHLNSVKLFYFAKDSFAFNNFTDKLFTELWHGHKVDEVQLNTWVKEIYVNTEGLEIDRLSIHIIKKTKTSKDTIPAINNIFELDNLYVEYQIEWPTNLFINTNTLDMYNNTFMYILKLSCAQFILNKQMIEHFKGRKRKSNIYQQEMNLFRRELMHFVQTLRGYILDRIAISDYNNEINFEDCCDIDDMSNYHLNLLQKIQDQCMISTNFIPIKNIIDRILNICIMFGIQYKSHNSDDFINESSSKNLLSFLTELRNDFTKNHKLMQTILSNLITQLMMVDLGDLLAQMNFNNYYSVD